MFDIGKYLEKFKVMGNSRHFLRNTVLEAIKEVCDITIDPQKVEVKDGIARISEKPVIKSEIYLKKAKILESIQKKTENKIRDIL